MAGALLATAVVCGPFAALAGDEPDVNDPCPSPSCGGGGTSSQDDRALTASQNAKGVPPAVKGTEVPNYAADQPVSAGVQGAMPSQAMTVKTTPRISLVQYFPWQYKDIDSTATDPYWGTSILVQQVIYRGTGGNTMYGNNAPTSVKQDYQDVAGTVSDDANASTADNSTSIQTVDKTDQDKVKCKPISIADACTSGVPDYPHIERFNRLHYDNCANQYLLGAVLTTAKNSSAAPIIMTQANRDNGSPWNESLCQQLKMVAPPCIRDLQNGAGCKHDAASSDNIMYDYRASAYLWEAWVTVLDSVNLTPSKPYYKPNDGISVSGNGNPPVVNGASASQSYPIKGPAVSGEDKIINFGSIQALKADPTKAGSYGYTNTSGCGTDTGSSCGGGGASANSNFSGTKVTLKDLYTYPYERIWDASHPFTPRWDWKGHDRDKTPKTLLTGAFGQGYDVPSGSQCVVRCGAVPVDILSFRQPEFDACMNARINLNQTCFWTEVTYLMTPMGECRGASEPEAVQDTIDDVDSTGCHPLNTIVACKTYFVNQNQWPPCSTKYDHPADADNPDYCQSARQLIGDTAQPKDGVKKCCDDLAQALTPINTLKIRNTKLTPALVPVPEGYSFKDYFPSGDMPYMRWPDTGNAAGGHSGSRNYNPDCDLGKNDVIVGVGVEGHSCGFGGNGAAGKYPDDGSCINLNTPDALTSWTELKQYQMETFRKHGLNCLANYEKVYKQFGSEDGALNAGGGYFPSAFPQLSDPNDPSSKVNGYESKTNPWPLVWRGYLSDPDSSKRFPNFGSSGGTNAGNITGGLDNVQIGDIIYLTFDDVAPATSSIKPDDNIFPFLAVVTGTGKDSCDSFIQIKDVNNGKFPDVCGVTDYAGFGEGQPRRVYKNSLPSNVMSVLNPAGTQNSCGTVTDSKSGGLNVNSGGSCNDVKNLVCTFGTDMWTSKLHIYRPCKDTRGGSGTDTCPSTTSSPSSPSAP